MTPDPASREAIDQWRPEAGLGRYVAAARIEARRPGKARRRLVPLDPETAEAPAVAAGDDDHPAELLAALLPLFVGRLPTPYRDALAWTELEGMTQQAAAARAGISLPGMKSRVQRGRRMLEDELRRCCALALDARRKVIGCRPKGECGACG